MSTHIIGFYENIKSSLNYQMCSVCVHLFIFSNDMRQVSVYYLSNTQLYSIGTAYSDCMDTMRRVVRKPAF